jgi:hypothetical protein
MIKEMSLTVGKPQTTFDLKVDDQNPPNLTITVSQTGRGGKTKTPSSSSVTLTHFEGNVLTNMLSYILDTTST